MACADCPAGKFSIYSSEGCQSCPGGKYMPEIGSPHCFSCASDKYSKDNSSGVLSCADCPPGKFQTSGGRSYCEPLPPGSFVSTEPPYQAAVELDLPEELDDAVLEKLFEVLARHAGRMRVSNRHLKRTPQGTGRVSLATFGRRPLPSSGNSKSLDENCCFAQQADSGRRKPPCPSSLL